MKRFILAAILVLPVVSAFAQVTVKDPWVRATVPQQSSTGAFMQLTAQHDTHLIEVHSPLADAVEIHEMKMENDIMKMREITGGIDLPAAKAVDIKPGGYHFMFIHLKQQIKAGDVVPMTLVIEDKQKKRTSIAVNVPARALDSGAPGK